MALNVGDRWAHPRSGTSIEVVGVEPTVVRRVIKPGNGKLKAHYHLDFTERFWIESGRATLEHHGERVELGPGDEYVVAPREAHLNPWNAGAEDLVYRQSADPTPPFIAAFVQTYGACLAAEKADRQDELPLAAIFAISHRTRAQSYAAGVPRLLQRHAVAPLGPIVARLRGLPVAG